MSRLEHVLAAAAGATWAIQPEKLDAIVAVLQRGANGITLSTEEIKALSEDRPAPKATTAKGIAVLPLFGMVSHRVNMLSEFSGGTSTERFAAWFDQLANDPSVSAIVLDVDSPGGTVQGTEELARKIHGARGKKPIYAIANSLAASAAYWIATAADEVWITPSGEVGSIGVYALYVDTSEKDAKEGVRVSVYKAGKYKAEGAYGPLTAEAEEALNGRLNEYYSMFVRAVARNRGVSVDAVRGGFGQGRVVGAKEAVELGMADKVGTLDDLIAALGGGKLPSRKSSARAIAAPAMLNLDTPLDIAASAAPALPDAVSGDAAPVVVPVTEPAAKAKEHTMSPEDVAAAAAAEQLKAKAAQDRLDALAALATEHPTHAALPRWIKEGVTVEAARGEIMTQLKAELAGKPALSTGSPVIQMGAPNEAKKPFASFGEQMVAVVQAGTPGGRRDHRLNYVNERAIQAAASGMNESIGSEGGFFIAPELLPGVIDPVYTEDPIVSRVNRIPMSGNAVKYNVVDETSRVNGSRYGGIQMFWAAEADTATAKKPKLRQMELALKKIIGIGYLTDELMQDAPAAEALLTRAFQAELAFMLADAIYRGTGAGQPLGFMNSGAVVSQAIEGTQTIANSNTFIGLNVTKMLARVPASLWGDLIWLYQQELLPTLVNATIGAGGTVPLFIGAGGLTGKPFDTILGRPAFASELCEAVGTPGDIIAAVPSQYNIADKGGPQAATSLHVRFLNDENTLRITYRTDGHPVWTTAVTPYKGAATRSPFVTLAVRS